MQGSPQVISIAFSSSIPTLITRTAENLIVFVLRCFSGSSDTVQATTGSLLFGAGKPPPTLSDSQLLGTPWPLAPVPRQVRSRQAGFGYLLAMGTAGHAKKP
jgi:hypothetical protein